MSDAHFATSELSNRAGLPNAGAQKNLIDCRELFTQKWLSLLGAMLDGESLPEKNGDVVQLAQRRCGKIGGEAA